MPKTTKAQSEKHEVKGKLDSEPHELLPDDYREADDILRMLVENDQDFDNEHRQVLWKSLRWDDRTLKIQRRRMYSVIKNKAIAGDSKLREQMRIEAAHSAKILQDRGPQIREEIAALEAQLRSLETSAKVSAKRVEEIDAALDQLKKLVPDDVQFEINKLMRKNRGPIIQRIHEIEGLLRYREQMINGPYEATGDKPRYSEDLWLDQLKSLDRELLTRDPMTGRTFLNAMLWNKYQAEWEAEKVLLEGELADMRNELAGCEAEIEELRQFYWR